MAKLEGGALPCPSPPHLLGNLGRPEHVDLLDAHLPETFPRPAVEGGCRRVGVDDRPGVRIDDELGGRVPLELGPEARLALAERLLGCPPLGDVLEGADQPDHPALFPDDGALGARPDAPAPGRHHRDLQIEGKAVVDRRPQRRLETGTMLGVDASERLLERDDLPGLDLVDEAGLRREPQRLGGQIQFPAPDLGQFPRAVEHRGHGSRLGLRSRAFGDVLDDPHETEGCAVRGTLDLADGVDPTDLTRRRLDDAVLQVEMDATFHCAPQPLLHAILVVGMDQRSPVPELPDEARVDPEHGVHLRGRGQSIRRDVEHVSPDVRDRLALPQPSFALPEFDR